ncbi:RNase adapter RapZ [Anaeromicropila herbilytica]|uniref:Nucleotide-binding protein n=1 Tax=Anaeromicropila herbilytica TaxID=2785025 RepID=A0A7R7EP97_9FIRM|nr:RNase adapter RapZ [Anaeromicropila herbilytica]BCN32531.1 nucleotide-binding protein [Anaeromicropila herbilytica]
MRFVIVTGMSGAGKSSVLKMLEDTGYFCVDNLPIQLIHKFTQLTFDKQSHIEKVALGVDVRSGEGFDELETVLTELSDYGYEFEILFLEASTEVLVTRYKETRRSHPLCGTERVDKGIELEREKLSFLKKRANYIIDTSKLLIRELKAEIDKIFVSGEQYNNLFITILSFGFKYGIPTDSDLVFDVRFLPNPYYIPELKPLTGNDTPVSDYVMKAEAADRFLDKLEDMLSFLIPNYITEGKNQLVVSIGCTGGKHRSVTLANAITKRLSQLPYSVKVEHRDIEKDAKRKS